jgi:hypothetical protein
LQLHPLTRYGYVDLAAGGLTCGLMDEYLVKRPAWL